jgi:hypothetical protein
MFRGVPQRHKRLYGDERSLPKVLHLGDAPRLIPSPGLWPRIGAIARLGGVSSEYVSEVRMSFTEAVAAEGKL